jgi:hypothetical protein
VGSDKALSDEDMPWKADRPRANQPWGDRPHGPVFIVRMLEGNPVTRVWCYSCDWYGPDRSGDPNSLRLVEDDASWHYHSQGVRCGTCEQCLPDGAVRRAGG